MEHQTAGVRPTRLHRAVSQPLDRVESSRGSRRMKGEIQRKTVLNLTTLRDIGGDDKLHRYLLGIALVASRMLSPTT